MFSFLSYMLTCYIYDRLALDMDIHGYIRVWISNLGHKLRRYMDVTSVFN